MGFPAVVADGGELTVVRRLVNFVYGAWDVEWPKDFEPPELDEGVRLGYVGRLGEADPGLSARRFSRSDVHIVASNSDVVPPEPGSSDVEEIFDTTIARASGDVFFEKDITAVGLGRLVPGRDFFVGDRIPVRLWGRVLPGQLVTSVRQMSSRDDPCSWLVHVGGQVVGDSVERLRQVTEVKRAIAQERRERVDGLARESRARSDAIEGVRSSLSSELLEATKKTGDAVAGVRVTAEAARQWTVENQQSFNLATSLAFAAQQQTNDFNAIQWVKQAEWNKTQEEINQAQAEINAAQEQVNRQQSEINDQNRRITSVQSEALSRIQAQQRTLTGATETLQRRIPSVLAVSGSYGGNEYLSYEKYGNDLQITAKPGWSGVFVASIRVSALSSFSVHLSGQVGPTRNFSYGVGAFEKFSSGFILILPS